ncbi:MAG: hypothetical protein ACRYFS_14710, partial [Janthinobacterium lividum]
LPQLNHRSLLIAGVLLLSFADLAHFGGTLYPLTNPAALFPSTPNIAIVRNDPDVQAHQARIMTPTGGVWLRFTNYKDFRQSVPNYQMLWADSLVPNSMMPYGLSDAFGYEPVALKNMETAAGNAAWAFDPKAPAKHRAEAATLSGALGVKYITLCRVTPPEDTLPSLTAVRTAPTLAPPGRKQGPQASIYLSTNTKWQPRAHLGISGEAVALTDDGPDRVTLSFQTITPDRLILEDTQAAGWQATLDSQPTSIATYKNCLRSVVIANPGQHRVIFSYNPTPFRLGLYFSLLTLAGLIGAGIFSLTRKLIEREGFRPRRVE